LKAAGVPDDLASLFGAGGSVKLERADRRAEMESG
jgi:hypothetical protein